MSEKPRVIGTAGGALGLGAFAAAVAGCDIRPRSHRHAKVGLRESGRVVDAIARHRNHVTVGSKSTTTAFFCNRHRRQSATGCVHSTARCGSHRVFMLGDDDRLRHPCWHERCMNKHRERQSLFSRSDRAYRRLLHGHVALCTWYVCRSIPGHC